jgi:uncharacterized GH25 family protein
LAAGPIAVLGRAIRVLVPLLLLVPTAPRAQEVGGALEGAVLDAAGAPMPEARVTVSGSSLQGARVVACDRDGRFRRR